MGGGRKWWSQKESGHRKRGRVEGQREGDTERGGRERGDIEREGI